MKLLNLIMLAGVASAATAAVAQKAAPAAPAQPYAFRGLALGSDLPAFKAMTPINDNGRIGIGTRCTDDGTPSYKLDDVSEADVANGVIACQWTGKYTDYDTPSGLFVQIGSGETLPVFEFLPSAGSAKLFRIHSFANSEYYPAVLDALTRGYGTPKTTTAPFQTVGGASFTQTISKWSNGASDITLTEPCRRLQRYCLVYRHAALGKAYDALVEHRAAAAASKL